MSMFRISLIPFVTLALSLFAADTTFAVTIGFENPPYSPGGVAGQDGWVTAGFNDAIVVANPSSLGNASAQVLRQGGSPTGVRRDNTDIVTDTFTVTADILAISSSTSAFTLVSGTSNGSDSHQSGGVAMLANSSSATFGVQPRNLNTVLGNATATLGDWYRLTLHIDPAANTGTLTAFNLNTSSFEPTGLANVGLNLLGATALDRENFLGSMNATVVRLQLGQELFVDNIGAPIPEPTTALLLATGLAGLAAQRRRLH